MMTKQFKLTDDNFKVTSDDITFFLSCSEVYDRSEYENLRKQILDKHEKLEKIENIMIDFQCGGLTGYEFANIVERILEYKK